MMRLLLPLVCTGLLLAQNTNAVEHAWQLAAHGQSNEAVTLLQTFIKTHPDNADARMLLGSLLTDAGKFSDAITHLIVAVRLRPRSAIVQNALAEAYIGSGDFKAARNPLQAAVAIKPDFGVAQMNLGDVLIESGEPDSAAIHLDRAIQLLGRSDDSASARYLRAKLYMERGDNAKAAAELREAVVIRPDFAQAWSDLGEAQNDLLDDAAALTSFERAVQIAPGDAVAQYRLGAEYLDAGKPDLAIEHLEQAYRLRPGDQSTLNALQTALRREGRRQEADSVKQKLSQVLRENDEANQNALNASRLNNEGASLQSKGDLRGAIEKYRAAVALAPRNVPMLVNYAIALLRIGEWTQGLLELREALRLDPANATIQETLKEALAQAPPETVPDSLRR